MKVEISTEKERGCGYHSGGKSGYSIYLRGPATYEACERLPFPLTICPTCNQGIKFSRGFTWINTHVLFEKHIEPACTAYLAGGTHQHFLCPMCDPEGVIPDTRAGLLWVGKKFYTPDSFIIEARKMGISKKISAVPKGFKFGKHYIFLAHIEAVTIFDGDEPFRGGVFSVFKPIGVDIVVDDAVVPPEKAVNLAEKLGGNARLIKVKKDFGFELEIDIRKQNPPNERR